MEVDLINRLVHKQTLISDLILLGANAKLILEIKPSVEELEDIVSFMIKADLWSKGIIE